MKVSEGQKVLLVDKQPCDKNHYYSVINLESIDYAALHLKGVAFQMWLYIAKNQKNYEFALSSNAFMDWCGCSKPTYLSAVKELEAKRFLVKEENEKYKEYYRFYEMPSHEVAYPVDKDDIKVKFAV
jgi:hypothetical protein